MKNLTYFIAIFAMSFTCHIQAQVTYEDNDPNANPVPMGFLGWNDTGNQTLDIRQNNTIRMRFNSTNWPGYNGAPGVTNSSRIHLGLDGNTFANPFSMLHMGENINPSLSRPWMQVGTTYGAGADIMYTGILQSPGNSNNGDVVDAVIAWGCNDQLWFPENGPDNLRFLFLAPANQPISPGSATEGLEVMRITPWGNAGIGDSFNNNLQPHRRLVVHGLDTDPQFRISTILDPDPILGDHADFQVSPQANLHIKPRHNDLDRTVCVGFLDNELDDPTNDTKLDVGGLTRIRTLTDDDPNLECLIVGYSEPGVNDTDPEDQFLRRIDFPDDENLFLDGTGNWSPGGADCRWEDVGSATGLGSTDIRTGFNLQDNCYRQNVIIGAVSAKSKLAVEARTERDNSPVGVLFDITDSQPGFDPGSNNGVVTALIADASGINEDFGTSYVGIQARSVFGRNSVGVDSRADAGVGHSIGVYSVASNAQTTGSPAANIAYYGEVFNQNDVIVYQVGGTSWTTGPTINLSDENIKSDIENLENASSILNQLQPKTYQLISPENRPIAFSDRLQYGLIAQEVLDVLPELVYETTVPELRDSSGAFIEGTSVELLGVNYDALVPLLVAGFNEQSGQVAAQAQLIEDQEETIEELENQLADLSESLGQLQESVAQLNAAVQQNQAKSTDCCEKISNLMGDAEKLGKQSSLEQNVPNPFQDFTQIDYNLATNGTVRLIITNELGQPIETLVNGEMSSGQHSVRWNASNQAPGVYYYTLYFNGDLITKKMIKL